MAVSVVMPALELAQESGKLLAWLKQEGDAVAKGDMIAEIETDKAVFELEAPAEGVLAGVKSSAGDMVPVMTYVIVLPGPMVTLSLMFPVPLAGWVLSNAPPAGDTVNVGFSSTAATLSTTVAPTIVLGPALVTTTV